MRVVNEKTNIARIVVDIPDIFGPTGCAKENVDIMPRMRAITALWDSGFSPTFPGGKWTVFANDGTFILNI